MSPDIIANVWATTSEHVIAVVIALITSGVLYLFRARVKILYGSTALNFHRIPSDQENELPLHISSEKFYLQNVGRKPASRTEIILSRRPYSYSLFSPREHTANTLEDGRFKIEVPFLAPNDLLILDVLSTGEPSRLVAVNNPDCIPFEIRFLPQRQYGRLAMALIAYLMFAGFVGTLVLIIRWIWSAVA